jgi:chromate transporter
MTLGEDALRRRPDPARHVPVPATVGLATIARRWGWIGCIGFGGPPAHIALLRRLCVQREGWITEAEFEDGIAAANLLPGPASTQLAIYTAWRLRGTVGAMVGGVCFIAPGLVAILALAALFLAGDPPLWVRGAAAGAGSAVAAVALDAAAGLVPASWKRAGREEGRRRGVRHGRWRSNARTRWIGYGLLGAAAAALLGPWLVLVLIAAGLAELCTEGWTRGPGQKSMPKSSAVWPLPLPLAAAPVAGGLAALVWTAFKVGALSYGGGFVIIPLMQSDAVGHEHWMTAGQFLSAVALGQITPGPVVQTVAVVGYAAAGLGGGVLAAAVAFAPSFAFVILGAPRFDLLRSNRAVQAFLSGAGPAAIGAIAGSAIPLALALDHLWQYAVLGLAALWLLAARRGVVSALLGAAALGIAAGLADWPVA